MYKRFGVMKANELRVDNWILVPEDIGAGRRTEPRIEEQVSGICEFSGVNFWFDDPHSGVKYGFDEIKPIPLTEDWLESFGFESPDYTTG